MAQVGTLTRKVVDYILKAEGLVFYSGTIISFRGESDFDKGTVRWNANEGPSFSACVTVGNEEDVGKAVRLARALKIGFLATASRHGYGRTLGYLKDGLAIDLSSLDSTHFKGSTLTVGPGATTERVMKDAETAGYEIPVGSHTSLSLVGVTIGAGVNRWSGVYGLVLDSLLSARLVLHDGTTVGVSESQNPDLFWAVRGAGANFGIVVSATYQLQDPINNGEVFSADVVLPIDQTKALADVLEPLVHDQAPELAIVLYVVWHTEMGKHVIIANWVWHGTEEKGRSVVQPLLDLKTISAEARPVRWTEVIGADPGLRLKNLSRLIYGVNLRKTDVKAFESTVHKMARLYSDFPAARGSTFLAEFFPNNASRRIADDTTAYPWRDATANLMIQMSWLGSDPAAESAARTLGLELRQDHARASGYPGLSVYVNYAVGDEALEEVYGRQNVPRLLDLKEKWDPDNVFCYHHPIVRE